MNDLKDTSFGYIDVDEHQDHAKSIGLLNVPSCDATPRTR